MILSPPQGAIDIVRPGRRKFLRAATGLVAAMTMPAFAQEVGFWNLPRELWLKRAETGEELRATYWADGALVEDGYVQICRLLRDTHMDLAVQFDMIALDIARGVFGWLQGFGMERPLIITSGYRHPRTNASEGGARNSQHMMARAIDMRIEGVSPEALSRFGLYLAGGGVGFYPTKHFTHLDSGNLRFWRG